MNTHIDPEILKEYNKFRNGSSLHTLCPAPSMNLHFSQLGIVTACCFNRTQVLGVYPDKSLEDIWMSVEAESMRKELASGSFPLGCEKCSEQIVSRDFGGSYANFYSQQAMHLNAKREFSGLAGNEFLPMKLEFNIHNNCNLQCIMCHGLASSSIRIHREGLNTMPNPYDVGFVNQLKKYLPQVIEADFMGGEPFMIGVYQSIWEAIIEVNPKIKTCILTNGTILNDSIKALLESFNCWIHMSIDSFKKSTYETIRKGAAFEVVMKHSEYFNQLMKSKGLNLVWRYCPMRINWHEIPDTVKYCTENEIHLYFNQLDSPIDLSLTTLPVPELTKIIETLINLEPELPATPVAKENLEKYRELIVRLSSYLEPFNRSNALLSRLLAGEAVVGHYTLKRENLLKKRENFDDINDHLSPVFRIYFINKLNIEQAEKANTKVSEDAYNLLMSSDIAVKECSEHISSEQFIRIYFKELIRVVSGIWGLKKVHSSKIFTCIDELADEFLNLDKARITIQKERMFAVEILKTYEEIAFADSVEQLRNWLRNINK